jgi:hypothetical protein
MEARKLVMNHGGDDKKCGKPPPHSPSQDGADILCSKLVNK